MKEEVNSFLKKAELFGAAYKSVRIRSLLADIGSGLEPVITVVSFLNRFEEESETILLEGRLLKVVQKVVKFQDVKSLLELFWSGAFEIGGRKLLFPSDAAVDWHYSVFLRGQSFSGFEAESTTVMLSGSVHFEGESRGFGASLNQEMELNPQLQLSSIAELSEKILGTRFPQINGYRIQFLAPSYSWLTYMEYHGSRITIKLQCMENCEKMIQFHCIFYHPDGKIITHKPRRTGYSKRSLGKGMIEITKEFKTPCGATDASSMDFTLSYEGDVGIDKISALNFPVANVTWAVVRNLDRNKIPKYLSLRAFQNRLSNLREADLFESLVVILLSACGITPVWMGGFKISACDMVAIEESKLVIIECTTGNPRDKIGLMKTAIMDVQASFDWMSVTGLIISSQVMSEAERIDSSTDKITIRDSADLKALLVSATESSDIRIRNWIGLE